MRKMTVTDGISTCMIKWSNYPSILDRDMINLKTLLLLCYILFLSFTLFFMEMKNHGRI